MSLVGCFIFYVAYREWMAWLFFTALVFLPWFSLLLSLPSMICLKAELIAPQASTIGNDVALKVRFRSKLPVPPVSWKYQLRLKSSARSTTVNAWETVRAEHCGSLCVELTKAWKYDFLGLFRWKLCKNSQKTVLIYPTEIPVEEIPSLKKILVPRWKPKGSGFSENYDLRPYRPGDSLKQIHWKLSAKTGNIIFREAIVPVRTMPVLTVILRGSEREVDEKLGKFIYLSKHLLSHELPHELHCLSGEGLQLYQISTQNELLHALTQMLHSHLTESNTVPHVKAAWKYHIGGEPDEV